MAQRLNSGKRCPLRIVMMGLIILTGLSATFPFKTVLRIKIMTTIFPLQEFARAVSGDRAVVDLLLPPGAEIHTWQPKPSDLVKLSSADVFIYVGAELEPWVEDILSSVKNPDLVVVPAVEGLHLLHTDHRGEERDYHDHDHGPLDPHIWLDFANDTKIIDKMAKILSDVNPDGRFEFQNNASDYKKKLIALDDKYRKGLENCDHRTIVLGGHAAFGYLVQRYNLSQISLYGLSPDSKPTPRQLIEVIEIVREKGVRAIFFEINVSNDLARVIAEETGAKTLVLNPGASLSREQVRSGITFVDIMEKNLENLIDGLGCR